ncbi:hypothetical protein DYB35_008812 [Aphanomyces astaci]|uniref:Uncharacterized protein n=1 Tax=Aphanomyces astaci TaxID=112090 RepID=A0A3R7AN16_APHAT|nr:hypothetical protein DYB35_008812 [Aphanomyces astaci]
MDITGIRDNFDATQFYRKLTQLGVDVVYHSHRAVIPGTGCHTNTWRVYFADAAIPVQLQINGVPVNQIKYQRFYYRVYFKGTKGTTFHSVNGVLRTYNGGFDTIKWKGDQDILTMIPTFQPRILSEEQRNQCITTMQVIDNNVTFDVELMTIGRLHLILEDSIELLQTEDLADMERTFAEAVADGLGSITEHVNTGQADKVWAQVQKKHLSANVALHGMAASDPTMFESVIQLHTWQRWFAASTDTNVQSFSNTYKQLYGSIKLGFAQLYHHRGEIKAGTAAGSTEPLTSTQILVEDALSLFELWLSIMARALVA